MIRPCLILVLMLSVVGVPIAGAGELPAFPGAEGFGTRTPGGRGGKVYTVSNLNDSGPGSLREACEAEGPRIIVFAVDGYISLASDINVNHPYCTIAGQTAPGGGICLRAGGLNVLTHDVVIRHVRFRMGRLDGSPDSGFRDGFRMHGTPPRYNVVLDHCSITWAMSRNIITWGGAHDITVQWCIIAEPLYDPGPTDRGLVGMGFLIGDNSEGISVHHTLFAHNYQRNPRLKHGVRADLVNNVVYNWQDGAASLCGDFKREPVAAAPVKVNIINCWYKAGINGRGKPYTTPSMNRRIQSLSSCRLMSIFRVFKSGGATWNGSSEKYDHKFSRVT